MSYIEERARKLHAQAKRDFESHFIRKRSDGRWLLQRQYEDGDWSWIMAAEVISLAGGELYVGGDIDFVIFAHYSDKRGDHLSKVQWMGECSDFGYYVRQKACIGTGRSLIDVYDEKAAEQYLRSWLADERLVEEDFPGDGAATKLAELLDAPGWSVPWDDHRGLIDHLHEELGHEAMSERYDIGMVLAPRVFFAHAALARLCALLDAEEAAA